VILMMAIGQRKVNDMYSHVGKNIRTIRKFRKLTQEQLAQLIGSNKSYVWKLENETPKDASIHKIVRVARALDVSLDYLFQVAPPSIDEETDNLTIEKYKRLDIRRKVKVKEFIELIT